MKKNIIIFLMLLLIPFGVKADTIYNIDMDIYIDKYGTANITEVWDVKADSGSEWYKSMYNLGNSRISNFSVRMDGNLLTQKEWDVDENIDEKSGYYGINNTEDGPELCFGKSDHKRHTFTLTYNVSNYVFNTSDSQVLYWTLLPNMTMNNFSVEVNSYYTFPYELAVWGYGYKGYAYVENGLIKMSNEGSLSEEYVVLLAKFPLGTFETTNQYDNFNSFNDVHKLAKKGSYKHNYESLWDKIVDILIAIVSFGVVIISIYIGMMIARNSGYGYIGNKKINKKDTPMFRDIPCNKDIYYANTLIYLNSFGYAATNIMGAIILKWVKEDKVKFIKEEKGLFNKVITKIELNYQGEFTNGFEKELYDIMRKASIDGILETKELEKWCETNYEKFLKLFEQMQDGKIAELRYQGRIFTRRNKQECKYNNVMDDTMYNDSKQLLGLKLFLEEFSRIDQKETLEVKIWDEYLMFAYLFGIADKVAKQLKNLYPEVIEQANIDYDSIVVINRISSSSLSRAMSAKAAAENYNAGGGGFSSGGGGGGSFGGGGGGGGR